MMIRVSAAVIKTENKYLICKRKDGALAHLWEFPGGKEEPGESSRDCIIREIHEELGIEITPLRILDEYKYSYPDREIYFTFWLAEIASGSPALTVHEDMRQVTPGEMAEFEFCPADKDFVRKLTAFIGT